MVGKTVSALLGVIVLASCASTETSSTDASLESTTVVASTGTDEVAVSESEDGLDPNRKVCKPVEVSGSRIARSRICRTAAEWEAIEDATQNAIRRRLRNTSGN